MDSYLGLVQQFHIGYKPYSTFINDCVKAIGKPRLNNSETISVAKTKEYFNYLTVAYLTSPHESYTTMQRHTEI